MKLTRITHEQRGPVAVVTMNRPEVHNAFDEALIAEMIAVFEKLSSDGAETRAAILQGAGASFSAGADMDWMRRMAEATHEQNLADAVQSHRMFEVISGAPFVTVARVHGAAMGGGVGLIAACDIAIAENTALHVPARPKQFGLTEVRLGIAPAIIAPFVVRKIGVGAAHTLFLTGDRFTAEEAHRIGLVQQVVPPGQIDAAVQKVVDSVLQSGPSAISAAKGLLRRIEGATTEDAANETTRLIAELRASEEGQEGIKAFLEKRPPKFAVKPDSHGSLEPR